jgi:hypothetical protein
MKEQSKLPLSLEEHSGLYLDAEGYYFQDSDYVVKACNNFPKAIELLRLYHKGASCKERIYLSEVDEFLKEIENV